MGEWYYEERVLRDIILAEFEVEVVVSGVASAAYSAYYFSSSEFLVRLHEY